MNFDFVHVFRITAATHLREETQVSGFSPQAAL
jgi:hypothetical protein